MLFSYIKKHNIRVIWTLHDCWSFTGHGPCFSFARCEKWKNGCGCCPQLKSYPATIIDNTAWLWEKKKNWFNGLKGITLVTPSEWLARLVQESFLSKYPVKVINNGIDLSIFKPTDSNFRGKNGITDSQIILLGVAYNWSKKKGLDVFLSLAKRLPKEYVIVLVGTNIKIDEQLPSDVISIHRTNSQEELAEIYSAADLFVNPTRERIPLLHDL